MDHLVSEPSSFRYVKVGLIGPFNNVVDLDWAALLEVYALESDATPFHQLLPHDMPDIGYVSMSLGNEVVILDTCQPNKDAVNGVHIMSSKIYVMCRG